MKAKHYFSAAIILCLLSVTFSSCDHDHHDPDDIVTKTMPNADFSFTTSAMYGQYVTNGYVLEYTVAIDEDKSSSGIYIDKAEYYWDGELIQTATNYEHKLNWLVDSQTLGEHSLQIKIYVKGDGYSDTTYTFSVVISVVDTIPNIDFIIDFPEEISGGDTFTCTVGESDETTLDVAIEKVSYYWDDELLLETSLSPYEFAYPVYDQTPGIHVFMVKVHVTGEWNGSVNYTYYITVTE